MQFDGEGSQQTLVYGPAGDSGATQLFFNVTPSGSQPCHAEFQKLAGLAQRLLAHGLWDLDGE